MQEFKIKASSTIVVIDLYIHDPFELSEPRGGGGGALTPYFGRYVPQQSENGGLRSELECENWVSGADFVIG